MLMKIAAADPSNAGRIAMVGVTLVLTGGWIVMQATSNAADRQPASQHTEGGSRQWLSSTDGDGCVASGYPTNIYRC
jgi:hypothetical protein